MLSEAESKEKHGVWDFMPELTKTSPYVHSRVDSNTFTMGKPLPEPTITIVGFIPQSDTLDLATDTFTKWTHHPYTRIRRRLNELCHAINFLKA